MAKSNSLLRLKRRTKADDNSVTPMVSRASAESAVERVYLTLSLASLETLKEDFGFSAEQIKLYQDLCQVRFQKKRVEIDNTLKITT